MPPLPYLQKKSIFVFGITAKLKFCHQTWHLLSKLAEFGFRGLNLTIPHKVDVLPLLSSIDEQARAMGAVNTLMGKGECGATIPWDSLSRAIFQAFKKQMEEFNILVLGAGGAARAAVAQSILKAVSGGGL